MGTAGATRYRLGKYQVHTLLGAGGMGAVYRALDTERNREVALKVLAPEAAADPTLLERFRREARHGAWLKHEHIVNLYDFGEAQGTCYLAMEFVDGADLSKYIRVNGRIEPDEARTILTQMAHALEYIQGMGLVHRDIKPSNILLTWQSGPLIAKLADLGLIRLISEEEGRVTRDGTTVGTVDYLSPEQARNSAAADIRSDLYSLGCTLFHMLAGKPPFPGGSMTEKIFKHAELPAPDPRLVHPDIPEDLSFLCSRLLAKKPEERFQTAAELLRAIEEKPRFPRTHPKPIPAPVRETAPEPVTPQPQDDAPTDYPGKHPTKLDSPKTSAPQAPQPAAALPPTAAPLSHSFAEIPEDASVATAEQRRVAAGQFERALNVLTEGNLEYGLPLLLTCCQLDPTNLLYRQTLRQALEGKPPADGRPRLMNWFGAFPARFRLQLARRAGDHLKVLYHGEEVLLRFPADTATHLAMAEAAQALGFRRLPIWILQQAHGHADQVLRVDRALALCYEKEKDYPRAQSLWEGILRTDPDHEEARHKVRDLAANVTIARGRYRQHLRPRRE